MSLGEILAFNFIEIGSYSLNLAKVLSALFVLAGARFFIAFLHRGFLQRLFKKRKLDVGRQYTIYTLFKYVVYTIAVLWGLQLLGFHLSVILGSAAALLVGIGLGLQQTFNDLISGIILLSEGTVEVGDVLAVDGMVGKVKSIGIRTSDIETLDNMSVIIPNSKLVVENVVNWSHNSKPTRFSIQIGVGYNSDVQLVTQVLLQVVNAHNTVLDRPASSVLFKEFGASSLDFEVYFFTDDYLQIEVIKSEIRYRIIEEFRAKQIEIPFPQNDIWIRGGGTSTTV